MGAGGGSWMTTMSAFFKDFLHLGKILRIHLVIAIPLLLGQGYGLALQAVMNGFGDAEEGGFPGSPSSWHRDPRSLIKGPSR